MRTFRIIELSGFQKEHKKRMPAWADVLYTAPAKLSIQQIEEAEIIIGRPPIHLLPYARRLQWLQLDCAGSEQYAKQGLLPKNCILTNASGSFGTAISEYLLCTILMLMRNMKQYMHNQLQHTWNKGQSISSIYGSCFLIVGMGDIGASFAKRAKLLGAMTIGVRRRSHLRVPYVDELYSLDELPSLLPRADVVVLALPDTPETKGCFKDTYYALMKPTAFLANVGRGSVLHSNALLQALRRHIIAGAVLDVFEEEPLPADHPFWEEKNLILTPHISGTFQLPEAYERFVRIVMENLQAFYEGKALSNVVESRYTTVR